MDLEYPAGRPVCMGFSPTIPVPEKIHALCVQEKDDAGNPSGAGCRTVTVDFGRPCSRTAAPAAIHDRIFLDGFTDLTAPSLTNG